MRASGRLPKIWRAASSPLRLGIPISRRQTSGLNSSAILTASRPSFASEQTSQAGWSSSNERIPCLAISWSSAIRIRSTPASPTLTAVAVLYLEATCCLRDRCASTSVRLQKECVNSATDSTKVPDREDYQVFAVERDREDTYLPTSAAEQLKIQTEECVSCVHQPLPGGWNDHLPSSPPSLSCLA